MREAVYGPVGPVDDGSLVMAMGYVDIYGPVDGPVIVPLVP